MSILFDGTTDYYVDGSWAGPTVAPLSIAGWANTNSTASGKGLVTLWESSSRYFRLLMASGGAILMTTADPGPTSSDSATTTGTMGTQAWHHVAGVTASTSSRFAYLDGTESTTGGTGTVGNPTPTDVRLGANQATSPAGLWNGELAHFGVWNRVLAQAEITALAQGWHPRFFSDGLVWLWDGFKLGEADVYGSSLTETGTPAKSDEHPPVFFPSTAMNKASIFVEPAAAAEVYSGVAMMAAPSMTVNVSGY